MSDERPATDGGVTPTVPSAGSHRRAPESGGTSRRWFLAGGGVVLLAAGAGVGGAFAVGDDAPTPRPAPDALIQAIAAEQALIADLDATTGGSDATRRVITASRRDHAAHLQALRSLAADYDPPSTGRSTAGTTAPRGAPRSAAALRTAEQQAAQAATARASALQGRAAAVLASIAACEATHAELFS